MAMRAMRPEMTPEQQTGMMAMSMEVVDDQCEVSQCGTPLTFRGPSSVLRWIHGSIAFILCRWMWACTTDRDLHRMTVYIHVLISPPGLRQDPSRRVMFQPPVAASRSNRPTSHHALSPQPPIGTSHTYAMNPASNPNSASFSIQNYEPRAQMPLTLRPLSTPSTAPVLFKEKVRKIREAQLAKMIRDSPVPINNSRGMMLPGSRLSCFE